MPNSAQKLIYLKKTANKQVCFLNDILSYEIIIKNTSPYILQNVILSDALTNGLVLLPDSVKSNIAYEGNIQTGMTFIPDIQRDEVISVNFQVKVCYVCENPLCNTAKIAYTIFDEEHIEESDPSCVAIYAHNYEQELTDIIQSIALEEAALAAITNAEGAKIQKVVSMLNLPTETLLCLNNSVQELLDVIVMFEIVLRKKLSLCQQYKQLKCNERKW